ncbi:MAG: cation diffusion facilitator family transporter [Gammaproteobacteria bacterium]|nr:cation diffusion facilitator family transporter [Gammaproteobacteria bacterium]
MSPVDNSASDAAKARYREVLKVTLIGSAFDFILGVAKIVGGFFSTSTALIADGVHSLSDLFTDFIVIYAAKHSHREADEDHPYGHGRIETLATVGLGLALLAVAVGIAWDAVSRLFQPDRLWQPGYVALALAAMSIVVKEALFHYSMRIARKYRSNMLKANAWHSRTDAISSVIVVIGIIGSMAGLNYLDAIAAVGVAIMIVKISWDLTWHSVRELIDTGLEPDRIEAIRESILHVDGVKALHILRTRRMGGDALVDVHIQVAPTISVSEGHHISETVREQVIKEIEEVADVMVHIDPEDDETAAPNLGLPLRSNILRQLKQAWSGLRGVDTIRDEDVTLHYLNGKIRVELVLDAALLGQDPLVTRRQLAAQFESAAQGVTNIKQVQIYFA